MRIVWSALLAPVFLYPACAHAQSGYVSPDGKSRYPGVAIFCASGTGVLPCNFGGGGNGGTVTVNVAGAAVGPSNPFPVKDSLLEGLISGGALKISGSVSISGNPAVSLLGALPSGANAIGSVSISNFPGTQTVAGSVNIGTMPALPVGTNAIGSVSISNFPGTQTVAGSVNIGALPALPAGSNTIGSVTVSNLPATQTVNGSVAVSALPALAAGSNSIGSVNVGNFPATQPVSIATLPALAAGTNAIGTVGLAAGATGSVTAGGTAGTLAQAEQGIAGGVAMPVSGSFWQTTQPVSASTLPLAAGASTDANLSAPYAPVAPGTATATKSLLMGCLSNTTLPAFTAGQEGAVPCDTSGRPYVVTVPSANNVPGFLQAVTAGGASPFSALNAAASCMATNVKSSSGNVYGYSVSNSNSTGVWLRLFASGTAPTCGAGTPVERIYVAAASTVGLSSDLGWSYSSGIGFDVTSGSGADTDATPVAAANSVLVNIEYK